jgi:hypothetical protein
MAPFPLGRVVATPGALELLEGRDRIPSVTWPATVLEIGVISTTTTTRKMS